MGLFTDLFANAKTIDCLPPSEGASRPIFAELDALRDRVGDRDTPVDFDAKDEVQEIGTVTADDGTYTIAVTLANGETFTTGNIDHDDDAAAILAIINTAAAGVTGWSDGDISVKWCGLLGYSLVTRLKKSHKTEIPPKNLQDDDILEFVRE